MTYELSSPGRSQDERATPSGGSALREARERGGHVSRCYRVAIYFAPDVHSGWWRAGSEWIGRCASTGQAFPPPHVEGLPPSALSELTSDPRRYGWHATLKAPFQLAAGHDLDSLRQAMRQLCIGRAPFDLAPLQVTLMGNFLALRPAHAQPMLEELAADCVRQLHPLAAPLTDSELARRRKSRLTPEQDELLQAWGYPYVMQHFRFHFSLTGPLPADAVLPLSEAAAKRFNALPPCRVDRLSIFIEPEPGTPFQLLEQMEFQP
ncbi:MAG: DUF1045 domain-containing protein [Ottowia sp.]|uniref:DUF1045 domain-containing protein n=1 Tax=Ottowia sp. TaxID=1898956 RepID=UPI003C781D95